MKRSEAIKLCEKLREAGICWRYTSEGAVRVYIHADEPQYMADGSYWNGTETVAEYDSLDAAANCDHLAQTIAERA